MLPNAQAEQSEQQLPADIIGLSNDNLAEISDAVDVLYENIVVRTGHAEQVAESAPQTVAEPIQVDFRPRNLTADELRNYINRNAA